MSHPSWVCGLKHLRKVDNQGTNESHPSWVCGLKHVVAHICNHLGSHTLRGCVD